MGEVHLAKLRGPFGFEKLVVIKRLLDHRQKEKKYVDMFFAEARLAAQLNHTNICQVYEVGSIDGVYYIAMEYVAGRSLRRILDTSSRTWLSASSYAPRANHRGLVQRFVVCTRRASPIGRTDGTYSSRY